MPDLLPIFSPAPLVPLPGLPITIRPAIPGDLAFIDGLQKLHTKMVGWMPMKQLEGKIAAGQVIVAEETQRSEVRDQRSDVRAQRSEVRSQMSDNTQLTSDLCPLTSFSSLTSPAPLGYAIGHDQYFKRDDVGIIYQLNILPRRQRGLIGATLLKAMFERAAYGCRLFCCWCAQDIEANYFWESMGFVPLAFRAGGRGRGQKSEGRGQTGARVHIFWQRRIRAGDTTTPHLVSESDQQRSDPGGSDRVADPAGRTLARCDADCIAGKGPAAD